MSASYSFSTNCAGRRYRLTASLTSAKKNRREAEFLDGNSEGESNMAEQTIYAQLLALRNSQRALQAESPFVIRGSQMPWETNPQGIMRWYLHPAMEKSCHKALIFSV